MVSSILKLGRTVCSIVYVNAFLLYGLYLLFSFYYGIFVAHYKNTYDEE